MKYAANRKQCLYASLVIRHLDQAELARPKSQLRLTSYDNQTCEALSTKHMGDIFVLIKLNAACTGQGSFGSVKPNRVNGFIRRQPLCAMGNKRGAFIISKGWLLFVVGLSCVCGVFGPHNGNYVQFVGSAHSQRMQRIGIRLSQILSLFQRDERTTRVFRDALVREQYNSQQW